MTADLQNCRPGSLRVRRHATAFAGRTIRRAAILFLTLVSATVVAHSEDQFLLIPPDYSDCGIVSVNGVVITTPPTLGLVWDWGDGTRSTSWFPATHRYTSNGDFNVTVTAAGCNTQTIATLAHVTNAEIPGCPPPAAATYYKLVPYNMHLTAGATSLVPLRIVDQDGRPVSGTVTFTSSDPQDLVSISPSGYVTALRTENADTEIGVWVSANLNGQSMVSNSSIVRVLPANYGNAFAEASGQKTALYYPTNVNGEDIAARVAQFQVPLVNEYAYAIESRLMSTSPFYGGIQIFEVDFGVTESNRVCGISGNPLRLGWNMEGNAWQNCFMVPFAPFSVPNPQWFVLYHEVGHNLTWASFIFATALNHFVYSEGLASAIALAAMEEILTDPSRYPLGADASLSLQTRYDSHVDSYLQARLNWIAGGASFSGLIDPSGNGADILDGIWLFHKAGVPHFTDRFFLPLQPLMIEHLGDVLCRIGTEGENGQHTFFAAIVSAAAGRDLYDTFLTTYNYPLVQDLYDTAYAAFRDILAQRECPGDFDKDGSSDEADLLVFAMDYGKSGCSGISCNGDFNGDGDVDGSELSTFILKFGRSDCL
jgi:hypothetical protein